MTATMQPGEDIRVLIVANHASARFGGEAILPLHYFRFLREMGIDVRMLVHERTRAELDALLGADAARITYLKDDSVNIWLNRLSGYLPNRIADFTTRAVSMWHDELRQRKAARLLIRQHDIAVVHQPIPVSPKLPSFLYDLGAPVVIGPMNGGMDYPSAYRVKSSVEDIVIAALRSLSGFLNVLIPGKRRAALLLVANDRTRQALPNVVKGTVETLVENGVDLRLFREHETSFAGPNSSLRIAFVGRLVDFKRVDLLVASCLELNGRIPFHLDVIGDGPLRAALETQALPLGKSVTFHGNIPQPQVATLLAQSDVLVLPSMRECGGAVVLEAMAIGKPVIAAAWGGPLDYLDDDCGVLIPPQTPDVFVHQLAEALERLAGAPELRRQMGRHGRERVEKQFDWRVKARKVLQIYGAVASDARNSVPLELGKARLT
ncbi:MAG: glycosyltransferase family 4 protein [Hyphomicrobiales bacterium]